MFLLPKGESEHDAIKIVRKAEDTRPLSASDAAAKIQAKAVIAPINEQLNVQIDADQRGFVPGRMIVDNIIEMDTVTRNVSLNFDHTAAAIFFDFCVGVFNFSFNNFLKIIFRNGAAGGLSASTDFKEICGSKLDRLIRCSMK